MSAFDVIHGNAVVLEYSDLLAGVDLTEKIAEAYGADGLGILTVWSLVPSTFQLQDRYLVFLV